MVCDLPVWLTELPVPVSRYLTGMCVLGDCSTVWRLFALFQDVQIAVPVQDDGCCHAYSRAEKS